MKVLGFSPAAQSDLGNIWDYSARHWGADQADLYTDEVISCCRDLASGAKRGREVNVRSGYLKYAVGVHIVYFREDKDRVDVMRILHQRQDVSLNLPN